MEKLRKVFAPIILLSMLMTLFSPIPAQASEKAFEITKNGKSGFLNDVEDPLITVNFTGYPVDEKNHSYRMVVFDKFEGSTKVLNVCGFDYNSCVFYLKHLTDIIEPGQHEYFAMLDESPNPYSDFRVEDDDIKSPTDLDSPLYTSKPMNAVMKRSTISLSSNSNYFSTDVFAAGKLNSPTLSLDFSEVVFAEGYNYYVFDLTNDELIDTNYYDPDTEKMVGFTKVTRVMEHSKSIPKREFTLESLIWQKAF